MGEGAGEDALCWGLPIDGEESCWKLGGLRGIWAEYLREDSVRMEFVREVLRSMYAVETWRMSVGNCDNTVFDNCANDLT